MTIATRRRVAALGSCALAMVPFAGSAYGQQPQHDSITVQTTLSCSTAVGTGAFAVISWSVGAQNNTTNPSRDGRAGPAVLGPLELIKAFDACTPALFGSVVTAKVIGTVTLNETTSNGSPLVTVKLANALVTSDQLGDAGQNLGPVETVSLSYEKIEIINHGTGDGSFCWSVTTASPCAAF